VNEPTPDEISAACDEVIEQSKGLMAAAGQYKNITPEKWDQVLDVVNGMRSIAQRIKGIAEAAKRRK
jgi:hypothetical protein